MFDGVWDSAFECSEQVKFAKLMELMNKWPTTLSKLVLTTAIIGCATIYYLLKV